MFILVMFHRSEKKLFEYPMVEGIALIDRHIFTILGKKGICFYTKWLKLLPPGKLMDK